MASGYEKGFVIEYDHSIKKKISCSDCIHYDKSDKSCMKKPLYLPEDGYDSWKTCKFFELNKHVPNYEKKREFLEIKEGKSNKPLNITKSNQQVKKTTGNTFDISLVNSGSKVMHKGYGVGTVLCIEGKTITVFFSDKERKFQFPKAFTDGYLEILPRQE